jgi:RNA polymerase sigma-70 factor (ECF subfamily)
VSLFFVFSSFRTFVMESPFQVSALFSRAFSPVITSTTLGTSEAEGSVDFATALRLATMTEASSHVSRLLRDVQRSTPGALDRLLDTFRNYLRLLARNGIDSSLQGKADPSDLVQEVLLKGHQHFDQFRGRTEAELAGWLRQILTNSLADLVRRYQGTAARRLARERSLEEMLNASSAAMERLLAREGPSPSESAERRELGVVLADALAELNADHREVLVLRSLQERDWDEVARRMDRSVGAVRMLWARALKQLRPLIERRL